tara:strand:- start:17496 stop:17666 length:171 start_codon:yes stop_codon:yes gene_type:complete
MVKAPKKAVTAKQFLHAYLAMERPNTTHLFYTKGVLDFLVGMIIGIVIGIIIAAYV